MPIPAPASAACQRLVDVRRHERPADPGDDGAVGEVDQVVDALALVDPGGVPDGVEQQWRRDREIQPARIAAAARQQSPGDRHEQARADVAERPRLHRLAAVRRLVVAEGGIDGDREDRRLHRQRARSTPAGRSPAVGRGSAALPRAARSGSRSGPQVLHGIGRRATDRRPRSGSGSVTIPPMRRPVGGAHGPPTFASAHRFREPRRSGSGRSGGIRWGLVRSSDSPEVLVLDGTSAHADDRIQPPSARSIRAAVTGRTIDPPSGPDALPDS